MKAFLFILSLLSFQAYGNEVDALLTNQDVNVFLNKLFPKLKESQILSADESQHNSPEQFGNNRFFKMDINNDRETDLIVDGKYLLFIVTNNDHFNTYPISKGSFPMMNYGLLKIDTIQTVQIFIVGPNKYDNMLEFEATDTLVHFENGFIEYALPSNKHIEAITFKSEGCFNGTCPVFEIKVCENGTATLNANRHTKRTGQFCGVVGKDKLDQLFQTLNQMNFEALKNKYTVGWTDDWKGILTITYDDGKVKTIDDYGLKGTFGLTRIYNEILSFYSNTKWTKRPPTPAICNCGRSQ